NVLRHRRATMATSPTRSSWSRLRFPSTSKGALDCASRPGKNVSSASRIAGADRWGDVANAATRPAGMLAPELFVLTGPAAAIAAASSLVVVVFPLVAETNTTFRSAASAVKAAGQIAIA